MDELLRIPPPATGDAATGLSATSDDEDEASQRCTGFGRVGGSGVARERNGGVSEPRLHDPPKARHVASDTRIGVERPDTSARGERGAPAAWAADEAPPPIAGSLAGNNFATHVGAGGGGGDGHRVAPVCGFSDRGVPPLSGVHRGAGAFSRGGPESGLTCPRLGATTQTLQVLMKEKTTGSHRSPADVPLIVDNVVTLAERLVRVGGSCGPGSLSPRVAVVTTTGCPGCGGFCRPAFSHLVQPSWWMRVAPCGRLSGAICSRDASKPAALMSSRISSPATCVPRSGCSAVRIALHPRPCLHLGDLIA